MHYCRQYMIPGLISIPFAVFGMMFQLSFITVGKAGLGAFLSVLGGVLNIILDWLFMGKFDWGLIGAAIVFMVIPVLVLTLLISVFVLTISCMLGWMVARISQKLKHKSLITVLVSLAVFCLYYFVYFKAQTMIQQLLTNAAVYGAQIKGTAYPVYLFGSVGVGDVGASIIVSAAVAVLFSLMWLLLSHSFLQIATAAGKVARREYRETRSRQQNTSTALLCREFSRFAASPSYMLNCGLGTFLMPVCGIAVLWKGHELFAVLDAIFAETPDSVPFLLCVMLCSLASMNFMTAPSVSLEGKSLWLLQSLPVESWRIFRAKIRLQLLLTGLPLLLCIGCTAVVYPLHPMQLLMLLLFAGSYALLMALVGLFFGVKMPTLTWTSEIMPIKQGAPVMITLFCGFGYMVLLFVGFMLLPGWMLGFLGYMSCFAGANLLLSVPIYLWLRKQGAARFSAL